MADSEEARQAILRELKRVAALLGHPDIDFQLWRTK